MAAPMEDYNTLLLLSKLPPRDKEPLLGAAKVLDYSSTVVEAFIRDAVERLPLNEMPVISVEDIESIMDQLHAAAVSFPVKISQLKRIKLPVPLKREKRIYACLLRTLNGPGTRFITPQQTVLAADRERAIAGNDFGWGSSEAITTYPGYISKLLLQSVGVDLELLPKTKSVPAAIKAQIDAAWGKACLYHSWPFGPQ